LDSGIALQAHGRGGDAADHAGDHAVEALDALVEVARALALALRLVHFARGEALPLDAVGLEHFERAGQEADLVGAAEAGNRGGVFLVGDIAHRPHHRGQRPQDAVLHGAVGGHADNGREQRDHDAGGEEVGEGRLCLLIDLHGVVAARAAQRGKLLGQAGDLVVEIEHRDEAGAAADRQQQEQECNDGPDQKADRQIAVGEHRPQPHARIESVRQGPRER
jgi:hypothetical protein